MIASTHENEEGLIISSLEKISKKYQIVNFIIAPRHPNRSKLIYKLLQDKKLDVEYYSKFKNLDCRFLILDSFGKMEQFFNISDIVFLGGSLLKKEVIIQLKLLRQTVQLSLDLMSLIGKIYMKTW